MMTFRQLILKPETIPATTAWYVADLAEARGRQELFTKQSPQKLKALREHALICIHPYRDGNGRVSRLLMLLQCYHLGYEVGRYISLERLIEENKERYYETLEQSSLGWHESKHDPWPYVNYVFYILKSACREFEERMGALRSPRGAKTDIIITAIDRFKGQFTLSDLERSSPGVSRDMLRKVLKDLQKKGQVECLGRGPGAPWRKRG
jgi:Fic family protein